MLLESLVAAVCLSAGPHVDKNACDKALTAASMQTGSYRLITGTEEYYRKKAEDTVGMAGVFAATAGVMTYKFIREEKVVVRMRFGIQLETSQSQVGLAKSWRF